MTKTDLIFPAFSSRFVDFTVQFCFRCKFSFNEERPALESGLTVARFFSTNHNSLVCIATNEIASFWIDRSRQMAFSCKGGAKAGQKAGFRVMLKNFEIKKAFRYYIKQVDSMLPCVWFSNRSQKTSKCGKNISDTLGYASCATFLSLPHFDVICDLLLNRRTATWNLFVNSILVLLLLLTLFFTLREPDVYMPHGLFLGFLATFICFCVTILFFIVICILW